MVDSIRKPRGRSEQSLPHRVYYGGLDLQRVEPRNVFVLFDGTWNDEAEGSRTNVRKLWESLEENERQVKHYFRGVGNDEENGLFWRAVGGFTGIGERRIRRDAYSTLSPRAPACSPATSTASGSRSACASRAGAGATAAPGSRSRSASSPSSRSPPYLRPIDVHFLGVWDTVGAFGVPVDILGFNIRTPKSRVFRDNTIAENVRHATHCVAIDETRDAFEPTLFNHKPGVVDEVWFAGVHSDVGGGYRRDEDRLGDHTLRYMTDAIRNASVCDHAHEGALPGDPGCQGTTPLPVEFDQARLAAYLSGPPDTTLHTHGLGWNKSHRAVRVRHPEEAAPPEVRPQVHASALELLGDEITFVQQRFGPLRDRRLTAAYVPGPLDQLGRQHERVP